MTASRSRSAARLAALLICPCACGSGSHASGGDAGSVSIPDGGTFSGTICRPEIPTPNVIPSSDTSVTIFYRTDSSPNCLPPLVMEIAAYRRSVANVDGGVAFALDSVLAENAGPTDAYNALTYTNLMLNQPYSFTAEGIVDGGLRSGKSDFSPSVTLLPRPPPPASLTAQPVTTDSVTLQWTNPTYDGGTIAFDSTYVQGPDGGFAPTAAVTNTATSSTLYNLAPSTAYTFAMTSRLANTQESVFSNLATATTYTPPGTPTGVQATPGSKSVLVNWQAPASSGSGPLAYFILAQSPTPDFSGSRVYLSPADAGSKLVFFPNPDGGVEYFEVKATNQYGSGPFSAPVSATPLP